MALTAKKVYAILKRQISDMEAKLNSPVRYRGTVATADLLPLNPDIGDMYNIESKSIYGEAGMNVAWNGVVWDTMGAPIDMSLYLTKEEAETVIQRLVTEYFEKNPVKPGATAEQAQQIEQNKVDIASLKTETSSLREDLSNKITKFYASSKGETHLADSDNGKIMDMMLYGKSEQKQYSGKNLFDFHQLKPKNPNITTVTTTEDAIIVSSNAQIFTGAIKIYEQCDAFKGKTITISANIVKADNFDAIINFGCGLFYENAWHWKLQNVTDLGARYITVIVPETITKIQFILNTNDTDAMKANTITVSEYMVEYGSEPTTYEPYTGGIPSPNLDYPQEIKSVVNPTVKVCGKNLIDTGEIKAFENVTISNGTVKQATADERTELRWKAVQYDLKDNILEINSSNVLQSGTRFGVVFTAKEKVKRIVFGLNGLKTDTTVAISVDLKVGAKYIISCNLLNSTQGSIEWNDMMLEEGTTIAAYEPYHEQTVTLPYTLNAIPVSSGGNVTIDGQQYIADYVDVERGKLVRCVKKLFLKQYQWSKSINKGALRFYASTIDAVGINGNKVIKSDFSISSHFAFVTSTPDRIGTFTMNADGTNANIGFAFSTDTTTSSDDFNNWILNNKPFVFLSVLKEELPLTSEQTQALKELATYYPVTNISVNSEQLDGYTVFNYPISMENGWNYVKQQIGDTRDYIYDMDARTQDTDLQAAEAYVNSEYAVALTELEV